MWLYNTPLWVRLMLYVPYNIPDEHNLAGDLPASLYSQWL